MPEIRLEKLEVQFEDLNMGALSALNSPGLTH